MNLFAVLYLLMVFIFIGYLSFILIKYGVLPSISDSWYVLPKKQQLLFTFFCWGFAMPALIIGVELTDNFLMFLAGSGICFVGAAAAFKENLTKSVHYGGAYVGVVSSQLSIAFDFHMYYVNIISIALTLLLLLFRKKLNNNNIWWQEIVAFTSICYVLGLQLFLR